MAKGILNIFKLAVCLLLLLICNPHLQAQSADDWQVVIEPAAEKEPKDSFQFDTINKTKALVVYKRKIGDSVILQLQQDEAFWYANVALKQKEAKKGRGPSLDNWMQQKWIKIFLWIIVISSFLGIIGWYLQSLNIRLFRRAPGAVSPSGNESMTEDIFSIAYEKRMAAALENSDYRLAVRLLYLQTLARLSAKNLITFQQDKTNSEYLAQLYNTDYYRDFFSLTRSFEYSNYGQFTLSAAAFKKVQKDFETFNRQLHS